nr:MAG TPA: hypothetical protein [Caudoviricetes sp.]
MSLTNCFNLLFIVKICFTSNARKRPFFKGLRALYCKYQYFLKKQVF